MLKTLVSVFPSNRHWVLEFVQNAEDAGSTNFLIRWKESHVEVLNDGNPFSPDDVDTICRVKSRKNPALGLRGYLGIGFKSIYRTANNVEVHSGEHHFRFSRDYWTEILREGRPIWEFPWEVLPIDSDPSAPPAPFKTQFIFEVDSSVSPEDLAALRGFLTVEKFPAELILLLDHIQTIEVEGPTGSFVIHACRLSREPFGDGWIDHTEVSKGRGTAPENFILFRRLVSVPPSVRADPETARVRRTDVQTREIGVFFRAGANGRLTEFSGMIGGVYSFAPMENELTGLPFGIFGDFLSHPSRDLVNYGAAWNVWMRAELERLVREILNGPVAKNDEWWQFTPVVLEKVVQPLSGPGSEFWNPLREAIKSTIIDSPIIRDVNDKPHTLSTLVYAHPGVSGELGWDIVDQMLGPGRSIVNAEAGATLQRIRSTTGKIPIEPLFTVDRVTEQLRAHPESAPALYRALRHPRADLSAMGGVIPVLSWDGQVRRITESVAIMMDLDKLPEWLREVIQTSKAPIDPRVAQDPKSVEWLHLRGLEVVNPNYVLDKLTEKIQGITNRAACPKSWSYPADLIEATLYLAARRTWWRPEVLVAQDGELYPTKQLFLSGGSLDWTDLWKAGLLPSFVPVHDGYHSDDVAKEELGINRSQVVARLEEAGVHGFKPTDDRELIEDCAYNLFVKRANAEGHVLGTRLHRREVGYDYACLVHCDSVFEVKGMNSPGDVDFPESEYRTSQIKGPAFALVCVYGLPCGPSDVGYKEIRNPFRLADLPKGDSVIRLQRWFNPSLEGG